MSFFSRSISSSHLPLSHTPLLRSPNYQPLLFNRDVHITHIRPRPPTTTTPTPPLRPGIMSGTTTSPSLTTPSTVASSGSGSGGGSSGSSGSTGKKTSPHMVWYREIVPAMIPILLVSTTLFLALSLLRTHLSHSLSLAQSSDRIALLEDQLARMRLEQRRARLRDKRERERILPIVVERVLQRVGAMSGEDEKEKADEERLLV